MVDIASAIFLNNRDELLLLKRAPHKRDYPNTWNSLVGKKEENESIVGTLQREVKEEIGITDFEVIRQSERTMYQDGERQWFVTIFLCRTQEQNFNLNQEHTEYRWFNYNEIPRETCSPPFLKDLQLMFSTGLSAK